MNRQRTRKSEPTGSVESSVSIGLKHKLKDIISAQGGLPLPSTSFLARQLGCTRSALLDVLRQLRAEGIVRFNRGSAILPCTQAASNRSEAIPAGGKVRLREFFIGKIENGEWTRGTVVPKIATLAQRYQVSPNTITEVFRSLAGLKYVHKQGRFWCVGGQPVGEQAAVAATPLEILCIQGGPGRIEELFRHPHWGSFMRRFWEMSHRHGVFIRPTYLHPVPAGVDTPLTPAGRARIAALFKEAGSRLLGCLFLPGKEYAAPDLLARELKSMHAFRKPIVWINSVSGYYEAEQATRMLPKLVLAAVGDWTEGDPKGPTHQAVLKLADAGHHDVGFPCSSPADTERFARFRWENLTGYAQRLGTPFRIHEKFLDHSPQIESWQDLQGFENPALRKALDEENRKNPTRSAVIPAYLKELAEDGLVLMPLLDNSAGHHRVTALIAPNDLLALRYYRWLRYAGYRIPQDISLISFDRSDRILPYPISSLDLGHAQLGERAFRFLFGDRNVKLSRLGRLVGACQLNHFGSITRPASRRFRPN